MPLPPLQILFPPLHPIHALDLLTHCITLPVAFQQQYPEYARKWAQHVDTCVNDARVINFMLRGLRSGKGAGWVKSWIRSSLTGISPKQPFPTVDLLVARPMVQKFHQPLTTDASLRCLPRVELQLLAALAHVQQRCDMEAVNEGYFADGAGAGAGAADEDKAKGRDSNKKNETNFARAYLDVQNFTRRNVTDGAINSSSGSGGPSAAAMALKIGLAGLEIAQGGVNGRQSALWGGLDVSQDDIDTSALPRNPRDIGSASTPLGVAASDAGAAGAGAGAASSPNPTAADPKSIATSNTNGTKGKGISDRAKYGSAGAAARASTAARAAERKAAREAEEQAATAATAAAAAASSTRSARAAAASGSKRSSIESLDADAAGSTGVKRGRMESPEAGHIDFGHSPTMAAAAPAWASSTSASSSPLPPTLPSSRPTSPAPFLSATAAMAAMTGGAAGPAGSKAIGALAKSVLQVENPHHFPESAGLIALERLINKNIVSFKNPSISADAGFGALNGAKIGKKGNSGFNIGPSAAAASTAGGGASASSFGSGSLAVRWSGLDLAAHRDSLRWAPLQLNIDPAEILGVIETELMSELPIELGQWMVKG